MSYSDLADIGEAGLNTFAPGLGTAGRWIGDNWESIFGEPSEAAFEAFFAGNGGAPESWTSRHPKPPAKASPAKTAAAYAAQAARAYLGRKRRPKKDGFSTTSASSALHNPQLWAAFGLPYPGST